MFINGYNQYNLKVSPVEKSSNNSKRFKGTQYTQKKRENNTGKESNDSFSRILGSILDKNC